MAGELVITTGSPTRIVFETVFVCGGVPESVALTLNAYVPFVVALPVIAPDALRLRFGGKLPLARLQETAPIWFWVHGRSTAIHPLQ